MILSYDDYLQVNEDRVNTEARFRAMEESVKEILDCLKHPEKLNQIAQSEE
jgi:hypothetical protein